MKHLKKLIFIIVLMLPIFVKAITYTDYNNSISSVNNYINKYSDRNKYLVFDNIPYVFRNNSSVINNSFYKGGLLSSYEYNISKKGNNSYLATGKEYWTLTSDGSNQYYVDNTLLSKNPGDQSGIRVTQFVKPSVNVTGKGTYANPWVFREQFSVDARSNSPAYGSVSPSSQMVDKDSKAQLTITPNTGYMYSGSDCALTKKNSTTLYETSPVKKDISCTITFEIRKITINYSCKDGSGNSSSQVVKYNDPYTLRSNDCTRAGYTQTGWKTSGGYVWSSGSNFTTENGVNGVNNDILNLEPVWTGKELTATFNKNGATSVGSSTLSCTVSNNAGTCEITLPSITRSGFTIDGWSNSSSATSGATGKITLSETSNNTFYAITHKDVTITFNVNGNSGSNTTVPCTIKNTATTCKVTSPSFTPASGFTSMGGWSTGATRHSNDWPVNTEKNVSENATYYAQSSKAGSTYTITFYRNSNTSQTPSGGSASTAASLTQSCTTSTGYNGTAPGTSCNITSPAITAPSGFSVIGYSTAAGAHTSSWSASTSKSVNSNGSYYAQSSKAGTTITITFNVNGNSGSNTTKSCTTTTMYNGDTSGTSCSITSPTISPASGYTTIGWSTGATRHENDWTANSEKSVSASATYYAQSSKAGSKITITFYRNSNTSQTPNGGSASTATTVKQSCTTDSGYNGGAVGTSCKITSPKITAPSGFSVIGYSTAANTRTNSWSQNTEKSVNQDDSYYAQSKKEGTKYTATFSKGSHVSSIGSSSDSCTTSAGYNGGSVGTSCTVSLPSITANTGYSSVGWSTTSGDTTGTSAGSNYSLTKSLTLYANAVGKKIKITLNKKGGSGGDDYIFLKYGTGLYLESALSHQMTTSANPITAPTKKSGNTIYKFKGYYTSESGGTQLINSSGYKTSNFTSTKYSSDDTIFAQWDSHTSHNFYAVGSKLFSVNAWCIGGGTSCSDKKYKAYAVYCTECGMSAAYYKEVLNKQSSRPSRVDESCPNGGTDWIKVDDSSLDEWMADVRQHSIGRFKQVPRGSVASGCSSI